jgi:phage tail tube protein FII
MQIPNHVTNYSIFKDGQRLIGCGNVTLPDLKNLEDPLKGSGIFGEIGMPVQCHFQPYSLKVTWLTIIDDALFSTLQQGANLDAWAAMQYHDSSTNKIIHNGWRFIMGTAPKGFNFGKLEIGTKQECETEYELINLRILFNDVNVLQIDKENGICRWWNGQALEDEALQIRQLIGLT